MAEENKVEIPVLIWDAVEVARTSRGATLYSEDNGVGGRRYWSDEITGGVLVWDTSLASYETLALALREEMRLSKPEPTPKEAPVGAPVRVEVGEELLVVRPGMRPVMRSG